MPSTSLPLPPPSASACTALRGVPPRRSAGMLQSGGGKAHLAILRSPHGHTAIRRWDDPSGLVSISSPPSLRPESWMSCQWTQLACWHLGSHGTVAPIQWHWLKNACSFAQAPCTLQAPQARSHARLSHYRIFCPSTTYILAPGSLGRVARVGTLRSTRTLLYPYRIPFLTTG